MKWKAKWIKPAIDTGEVAPVFYKAFDLEGRVVSAKLYITALGVYEARINKSRVGQFILAPGWTSYRTRLQYQEYDVTDLMASHNVLMVTVGKGWYRGRIPAFDFPDQKQLKNKPAGLLAQLVITYENGTESIIITDASWGVSESWVRFSEIYDGEIYDATYKPSLREDVVLFEGPYDTLIPQQGEEVREQEHISAACIFTTPKGETVVDFGQEITGYVVTNLTAQAGDVVDLSFAEVLDKDGNFYTANYRSSQSKYRYICREGMQSYKPLLTFYGFRYIRINCFPGGVRCITPETFEAIVLHSELRRTGYISCSHTLLNRLFSNIIWGQKCNFLDVPTDCPQRDERLGWTGDAQVFVRTACLNYDVEKFFTKWLADMAADQRENGRIGHIIPDWQQADHASAAWGDAAVICPWEIYMAYGNVEVLERQYASMCKWVDYITASTSTPYLWTGGEHFGDWLGLDAPIGSYKGSSREDFIASAYYAYSTSLVVKAGRVIGKDVSQYEKLYDGILTAFRKEYPQYNTQTECILAVHFGLSDDCRKTVDQLANMIEDAGGKLQTGFVGTPYLLHVLSNYGYIDLAYTLLLREEYPSWLYPVTKGATTIWEHWDGINEEGNFWNADMNSFNHYAYGSVADWLYGVAAGIRSVEEAPGFEKVYIAPRPDGRLDWLKAELHTKYGLISSEWKKEGGMWSYEIITPVDAIVVIDGEERRVKPGTYLFYNTQRTICTIS